MYVGALAVTFMVLSLCGMVEDSFAQTLVANAGPDQEVASGSTVTLDGSGSTPISNAIGHQWVQNTTATVQLTGATTTQATFTAPTGPATLQFTLRVTDFSASGLVRASDTIIITVLAPLLPPIADAGSDKTGYINDTITLDGTASTDPNGDALTYEWNQDSGTSITLDDFRSARTTFTAPSEPATLEFTLTVQDATHTTTDSITITIEERPVQTRNIKEMGDTLISAQITAPNEITMTYNEELSTFINSYLNFTISGESMPRSITGINGSPSIETGKTTFVEGKRVKTYSTTLTFNGEPVPTGSTGSIYVQHADYYLAFIHVSDGQE